MRKINSKKPKQINAMKLILLILILLPFNFILIGQIGTSTKLKEFELNGPVKEITTKNFVSVEKDKGLLQGELTPREIGSFSINILKFDTRGLLKQEVNSDSEGIVTDFRSLTYDGKARLLKYTIFKGDSSIYNEWDFSYPDLNSVIITTTYPSKENESSKSIYILNSNGKIKEIRNEYYKSDSLDFWDQKYLTYYSNTTAMHGKSMDNNSSSYLIIKDDLGNNIETINIGDLINYRISRKFDKNSMLQEEQKIKDGELNVETYSYEVDDYGNWTTKWTNKNGKAKFITTREIIYY